MQKKGILIAMFWVLAAVLLPMSSTSFAATIVPAGQSSYSADALYGTYPFVGSDEDSTTIWILPALILPTVKAAFLL